MDKWFDDKFEKRKLRKYTQRRLNGRFRFNFFDGVFRRFSVTSWLILINVVVYFFMFLFGYEDVISLFALQPNAFFSGSVWALLTSMFMHGPPVHLFANMISLFFIGSFVEKLIGRKRYFWLYLLSGLFAGLFYVTLSYFFGVSELGSRIFGNPAEPALGASGAIFALLGLLAVLTPRNKVYLIAGPIIAWVFQFVFANLFPASPFISVLNLFVTFYIIFAIISIISIFSFNSSMMRIAVPIKMSFQILPFVAIVPLVIIGLFVKLPIGNMAHLGGLLAGLGYGFYLKKKYRRKTAMIRSYFGG